VILLNDSYWLNKKVDGDVFHQQPKKLKVMSHMYVSLSLWIAPGFKPMVLPFCF